MWRTVKDQFAAHEQNNLVKEFDVLHRMSGENHCPAGLGYLAEQFHNLLFGGWVKP